MFGWIRPAEPVEGTRADGLIYASVSDVKDMRCMLENAAVRFNVYTDEKGIGAQNVLLHGAEDDGSEPQENGGQQFNPMEILALFGKGKSGKGKMPWSKGKAQPAMAGAADAKTSTNTIPGKGSTGIAN